MFKYRPKKYGDFVSYMNLHFLLFYMSRFEVKMIKMSFNSGDKEVPMF